MQSKPIVWLALGLVCVLGAVILVKKYLSRAPTAAAQPQVPMVKVLVASRNIVYGEALTLADKPEEANVTFVPWPEKFVPEGAFKKKEELQEKKYVSNLPCYYKGLPILKQALEEEVVLFPRDWYCEEFTVDEVTLKQLKPGEKADIRKVTGMQIEEFLRCLPIYAINYMPSEARSKEKETRKPPKVFLLMPNELHDIYLDGKLKFKFIVLPSTGECKQPALVRPTIEIEREQFQAAVTAIEEARQKEQWAVVLDLSDKAIAKYREKFADQIKKVVDFRKEAVNTLAANLLAAAEAAVGARDHATVVRIGREIEDKYPEATEVIKKAREMAEEAKQAQLAETRKQRYAEAAEALDKARRGGNLPAVREQMEKLDKDFAGYTPPPPLEPPAALCERTKKELLEKEKEYESMARLLEYYIRAGNKEKALEKYQQMKEKFPEHPGLKKYEEDMRKQGWL